jgi:ribonuclease E
VKLVVIPDPNLETPHYEIERVKDNDTHRHESNYKKSYELITDEDVVDLVEIATNNASPGEVAAVQRIEPPAPKPAAKPEPAAIVESGPGFFQKIWDALFGTTEKNKEEPDQKSPQTTRDNRGSQNRSRRGKYRGSQNRDRNSGNSGNSKNNADNNKKEAPEKVIVSNQNQKDDSQSELQDTKPKAKQNRSPRSRSNRSGNRQNRSNNQRSDKPNEAVAQEGQSASPVTTEEQKPARDEKQNPVIKSEGKKSPNNTSESRAKPASAPPAPPRANMPKVESAQHQPKSETVAPSPVIIAPQSAKPAPVHVNPVESKQVESKPIETKQVESKPVETKQVESEPVKPKKAARPKPVEAVSEAKATEPNPVVAKQVETKPASVNLVSESKLTKTREPARAKKKSETSAKKESSAQIKKVPSDIDTATKSSSTAE